MAIDETAPIMTTRQVTTNFTGPPTVADAAKDVQGEPSETPAPPGPAGQVASTEAREETANHVQGVGVEGEEVVWEARYAMKNFVGRILVRSLLVVAWIALAVYTWGYSDAALAPVTVAAGIAVVLLWLALLYRILQARFGHYYRLTTRRLFVSTGLMRRRRDMMELLRIKDVFTRQTLIERWLSVGTVVVVSSDKELPTFYLAGVDDPKRVMDMVWHQARTERDVKSMKVDSV